MSRDLPPGPRYPAALQAIGFWQRPLPWLERNRKRYGKRFTMRLPFTPPFVVTSDPEDVKAIFTAPPDVLLPGIGARVLEPLVGSSSVLLLDRDEHMEQRKLMLPAFHGERMERLADLVAEVTEPEVAGWGEAEFELHPRMQVLTLEIILRAVFGLDPGPRLEGLREGLATVLSFGDNPASLLPPPRSKRVFETVRKVPPFRSFTRVQDRVDAMIAELIAERREDHGERDDILSMLLEARHENGSPMTGKELRDELVTLLVAGHETTASSLAWMFSQLVQRPAILERLRSEVESGDDAYLNATIQETLRHRPVLPNVAPRFVNEPIEIGGYRIEPGVSLVANGYLLHHDADIYPDPYRFDPERFLGHKPGTYTWIPFGGGRRRCIGAQFALLEMRVVTRAILASHEVSATGSAERAARRNITIRPADGARVRLRSRRPEPAFA